MKTFFILPLILMALFLGACSEAPSSMAPIIEDVPELKIRLGLSNVEGFVSFDATTIPMVSGGSGDYLYELFQDGQSLGGDPIQVLHFTEVRVYQIKLKVTDRVTREEEEASVSFSGLQLPEGAKLENSLTCPKPIVRVEENAFMYGVARGGSGNYSHRMFLAGELVGSVPIMQVTIHELGDNELVLETTDMDTGEVAYSDPFVVVGLDSDPSVMHVNLIALPQTVELDKYTGLITILHGGQGPFEFEIRVDGQVVAWQPTFMYQMKTLGELIVMVKVTDATGVSKETGLSIFGVEREVYEPLKAVRIVAPNEVQQRQDIFFRALVFVEYDFVEWYRIGYPASLGNSDAITTNFDRTGFEYVEARVFNQGVFIAADTTRVTVTPADENPFLVNEVTGGPQGQFAPATISLESHPSGGDGSYSYVWYWPTAATIWSTERFPVKSGLGVGAHTFICVVTDGTGATATDNTVITVLERPEDDVVTWNKDLDLRVGPYDDFATTTTTVEVSGDYNSFVQVEWDAVHAGTQDELLLVLAKIVNGVEHQHVWHLIKPASYGQVTICYEIGNLNLEQGEVTLSMHWLGDNKSSEKCDGWDKWQLISGNATIPVNKSGDAMVIRLDDPNRDQYIKRQ